MTEREFVRQKWFWASEPVYEHPYTCVANLALLDANVVVPDGERVSLLRPDGTVAWQEELLHGTWGSPAGLPGGGVALASLEDALSIIEGDREDGGYRVRYVPIPAAANTEILAFPSGAMFLGVGSGECSVVCIAPDRSLSWVRHLGSAGGLRHPLARSGDGALWVPTDAGLYRLAPDTGNIVADTSQDSPWACISNPLPRDAGVLVVRVRRNGATELVAVSDEGDIMASHPLPSLQRARLVAGSARRVWLAGSSVDWQEPGTGNERVIAMSLDADGTMGPVVEAAAQTSVSASVDLHGNLWVGTYTYDTNGERGELFVATESEQMRLGMCLGGPASGFGAPLFIGRDFGVVATSNGVAAFEVVARL